MEEILETVFWLCLGYSIGKVLLAWFDHHLTKKLEKEIAPIIRDLDSGQLIPLTVELYNNQFFCYNSITNDFVCQGETLSELAERFASRFPGRRATIHRGETEVITKLKQQFRGNVKNISLVSK